MEKPYEEIKNKHIMYYHRKFSTISVFAVKQTKTADDVFQTDSSYITSENLALNKEKEKFKKLTDGNTST